MINCLRGFAEYIDLGVEHGYVHILFAIICGTVIGLWWMVT